MELIMSRFGVSDQQSSPIALPISRFDGFAKLLRDLGFKTGAEIGVSRGRYSKALCQRIPGLKLFCIDPWEAYGEYVEAHDEKGQQFLGNNYEQAKSRLAGYNCTLMKSYSMYAVNQFENESLDFVFIDGNHSFKYVIEDIHEWSKKVRVGGIVAGHDYWNSVNERAWTKVSSEKEKIELCQVKDAVDAWTKSNLINPWFVTTIDKCPSWFWVRE